MVQICRKFRGIAIFLHAGAFFSTDRRHISRGGLDHQEIYCEQALRAVRHDIGVVRSATAALLKFAAVETSIRLAILRTPRIVTR